MNLYATKDALNQRLTPLVDRLAAAGVSPDALTLGAIPVALLGGLALLASPHVPVLLLTVPALVGARLVLNLLDGQLARRTGRSHPRGQLYNEVGDRRGRREAGRESPRQRRWTRVVRSGTTARNSSSRSMSARKTQL